MIFPLLGLLSEYCYALDEKEKDCSLCDDYAVFMQSGERMWKRMMCAAMKRVNFHCHEKHQNKWQKTLKRYEKFTFSALDEFVCVQS